MYEPAENEKCLKRYAKYRFDGNDLFGLKDDCIKDRTFEVLSYLRKI